MHGSGDWLERYAPRKGPLVHLPIESSAPLPIVYSISSSAFRGLNCVDIFRATFSHNFYDKSLIPHSLKLQLEIFWLSVWNVKKVLILHKKHNVFHFFNKSIFYKLFPIISLLTRPPSSLRTGYQKVTKADRTCSLGTGICLFPHSAANFLTAIWVSFFISLQFSWVYIVPDLLLSTLYTFSHDGC